VDTDPQVTIEDCGAFLLDKFIDLALFLSKIQVLKFCRFWREFNQLLAIKGSFLISPKQDGGATEGIVKMWNGLRYYNPQYGLDAATCKSGW